MAHVSLRDIAREAGVSFQTASKALKGTGRVAPETTVRIREVALRLGYVPNTVARSLATRNTHSLGFVASGMASYVLTPLMHGVEREATANGYFSVFTLAEPGDHAERLVRQLSERRVEGIIGASLAHQGNGGYATALRALPAAVTVFDIVGGGVPAVSIDECHTGHIATRHLIRLGHRCVVQIVGDPATNPRMGRYGGYLDGLNAAGIAPPVDGIDAGNWTADGGYRAAGRLLDRLPDLTAIFAHNDHMAIGAIRAILDRGLRVPEDVSIIGCDDIDLAGFVTPALTTVQIPFAALGAAAVRALLAQIRQDRPPPSAPPAALLRAELIIRRTTGPAPGSVPSPAHV